MNPLLFILLLFIAVPLSELFLLIKIGHVIGAIPTIMLASVYSRTGRDFS